MVSREDLEKRRKLTRRREVARIAFEKGEGLPPEWNEVEKFTGNLVRADYTMKKGYHDVSMKMLDASLSLLEDWEKKNYAETDPNFYKYLSAVERRVDRLAKRTLKEEVADQHVLQNLEYAMGRIERIENKRRNHKSGLASKLSAIVGIIGILGAILFASPSVTGNAIGNLNQADSNFLGISLFIIGLVGIFVHLKFR